MMHSRKPSTIDYGDSEIVQTLSRRCRGSDEDRNYFYILRHDDETKKTNLNFYQIDDAYRIRDIGSKCLEGVTQVDWLGEESPKIADSPKFECSKVSEILLQVILRTHESRRLRRSSGNRLSSIRISEARRFSVI